MTEQELLTNVHCGRVRRSVMGDNDYAGNTLVTHSMNRLEEHGLATLGRDMFWHLTPAGVAEMEAAA